VLTPASLVNLHRYFETDSALNSHWRSKVHKRRCKQLKEPAYTIEEAERASGLGREGKRATGTQLEDGAGLQAQMEVEAEVEI
jgi:bud site selection protein 20